MCLALPLQSNQAWPWADPLLPSISFSAITTYSHPPTQLDSRHTVAFRRIFNAFWTAGLTRTDGTYETPRTSPVPTHISGTVNTPLPFPTPLMRILRPALYSHTTFGPVARTYGLLCPPPTAIGLNSMVPFRAVTHLPYAAARAPLPCTYPPPTPPLPYTCAGTATQRWADCCLPSCSILFQACACCRVYCLLRVPPTCAATTPCVQDVL